MTQKQIELLQKLEQISSDYKMEDVITAASCLVCESVIKSDNQRVHGYNIHNLAYRQVRYFINESKGVKEPDLKDVPVFVKHDIK